MLSYKLGNDFPFEQILIYLVIQFDQQNDKYQLYSFLSL